VTNYHVRWEQETEAQLTRIWLTSHPRAAVTKAQADADRLLAQDPYRHSRFVSEGLYRLDIPPLAIDFTIDDAARTVTVESVRRIV